MTSLDNIGTPWARDHYAHELNMLASIVPERLAVPAEEKVAMWFFFIKVGITSPFFMQVMQMCRKQHIGTILWLGRMK